MARIQGTTDASRTRVSGVYPVTRPVFSPSQGATMKPRHRLASVLLGIVLCAVLLPGRGPFSPASQAGDTLIDPAKLPEKRFAFSMEAKPWNQVFKWLADVTGQPVVAASVPAGTFSFASPKDRTY